LGIVSKFLLGKIPTKSRDIDDNVILATALVSKTFADEKKFKFSIVTPTGFLKLIGE
jgi:hypothetical protein